MCGIAGIYNYTSPKEPSQEINVKRMLSSIQHRGPDESGVYLGEKLCIGNVRLSIIDLASGQQPMSDISGNYWIVYNGEVFNYKELREELINKGYQLKTHCDTEVVVQMYAVYGKECLNRLNGQFAFCIWDKKKKELFFARDRVGIRPLYYWSKNRQFAFCSEIKGIFTLDQVERAIKPESLAQIFTFWTTLTPNTPYENVYELPPGHCMLVNAKGIKIERYWGLEYRNKANSTTRSLTETVEEFTQLFRDAIDIRLRADVPVGAYLSGGLDSSVTTAFIHENNPGILNTYSIGFADQEFDETSYQMEAARFFGTNHTAFKCTSEEIAEQFVNTIRHTEFPILRTAPTPMFLLSKKVRESNIKVVITGEGADEVLAGYNIFKEAKIRRFWANEPDSTFRPALLNKLYPYLPILKQSNNLALKMFFGYKLSETENPFYSHLLRWHNTSRIKTYLTNDITESINGFDPLPNLESTLPENFRNWSNLAQSQYLESTIFMSGYLLSSQGDRMAMGNSVEGRYPFLDYRIIEFCANLPDNFKLNSLDEKYLLKKMSAGKIPESILKRSKQAYRAPIANSFFNNSAPDYVSEILSEKIIKENGIFNPDKVKMLVNKVKSGNISEIDQMAIAGILSTQLIHKLFIKEQITTNPKTLQNYRVVSEF